MKRIIIIIILSALAILYACDEDFLETLPTGSANDAILANEKGVNALLIGAYAAIDGQSLGGSSSSWGGSVSNWIFGSIASDDATKGSVYIDQTDIAMIEDYTVLSTNNYVANRWLENYNGIARANAVLHLMAKCDPPLSAETQTSIKAQVLFIRGFIHFELKKIFNNIPYVTEDVTPRKVPNNVDTWQKIEADLQFAVDNLPLTQANVGCPTKYAAKAVLAKVYMFQKKWEEAKLLLDDIIESNNYYLVTNFGDNFDAAYRNNKESIFEIQSSVNDGSSGSLNGRSGDRPAYAINIDGLPMGWGFYQPTQNLVNAFQVDENGLPFLTGTIPNFTNDMNKLSSEYFVQDTVTPVDPRLDLTVARRGVPYFDYGIMRGSTWIRDQGNSGPYVNKKNSTRKSQMGTLSDASGAPNNANNYRLIRYSHILLWRAEVAAESSPPDFAKATELVNMIRIRANNQKVLGRCHTFFLPYQSGLNVDYTVPAANYLVKPYPVNFPDLDYARRAIRMENRLEFAMEGHRHFDLVRWDIAASTINAYMEQDRTFRSLFTGSTPRVFTEGRNEYWPIPQTQIDLQPGILTQNDGY